MTWQNELVNLTMGLKSVSFNDRENAASVFNLISGPEGIAFIDEVMESVSNKNIKDKLEKIKLEILTAQTAVEILGDIVEE